MNYENMVMLNFFMTVALAFIAYRQHVIGGFRREREHEDIHQEIRNNNEYFNGRIDGLEDRIDRDMVEVYRDLDKLVQEQPKKNHKGINSRIPL